MNELALQQQRTVDRIALTGSLIAVLAAAAFIAFDPVQTVARRAAPAAPIAAAPATAAARAETPSPLVRLSLPSATWSVVSDGTWAAYARLPDGQQAELVVRSLTSDAWRVAYRAAPGSYLGQLSLEDGVLAFEEIALPGKDALPDRISVNAVTVDTGEVRLVDSFAPVASIASSPVTDGSTVLWVRPSARGHEVRELDLASGTSRTVYRSDAEISGLALASDRVAFTTVGIGSTHSFVMDRATGEVTPVDGFTFSYVQSLAPDGVIVTASEGGDAAAASWLVRRDGTRTRLASDCFNVAMTARITAMRCATQIEIRDRATGSALYRFAGDAGALAVFDTGVVWGEGDALMLFRAPTLAPPATVRPE